MNNADLIAALDAQLDSHPGDTLARTALADIHEENGERWLAALHRWFADNPDCYPESALHSTEEEKFVLCSQWAAIDSDDDEHELEPCELPFRWFDRLAGDLPSHDRSHVRKYLVRAAAEAALFAVLIVQGEAVVK